MSKEAMKRLTRDDTEHGVEYYRADEVDALLADQPAQQEFVSPGGGYVPAIPAQQALDKMAENARELGLDYEPAQQPQRWAVFCQGCRKEWSVSYPHPGKDICVDCDDKLAQQDSTCSNTLRAQGKAYPRTCKKCGLGPCIADRVQPAQQEPVDSTQISKVWWDGEKLMAKPIPFVEFYKPAQRTWVGLSDEEKRQLFEREDYQGWLDYINAIEAKLKEKNT